MLSLRGFLFFAYCIAGWNAGFCQEPDVAIPVHVGGRELAITIPEGMVRVDGLNDAWDTLAKAYVPDGSRNLVSFAREEDRKAIVAGEDPELGRHLYLNVMKALELNDYELSNFGEQKEGIRNEIELMAESVNDLVSEQVAEASSTIKESSGAELDLEVDGYRVTGFFAETNEALGFTSETTVVHANGAEAGTELVGATRVALVGGKVLFFYAVSDVNGDSTEPKEWVMGAVRDWSDRTIVANEGYEGGNNVSSTIAAIAKTGMTWPRILAIATLLVGLIGWLMLKARKRRIKQVATAQQKLDDSP